MQDDLSLVVRHYFRLSGRTDRRTFNLVLVAATLPFLVVMIFQSLGAIEASQKAGSDPQALLRMLETLQSGPKQIDWAKLLTTAGVAYVLFPLFVRRLRDCGMALWWVWVIYASITDSAADMLLHISLPWVVSVPLGLTTLVLTFKMSINKSVESPLPDDHRSHLLPPFLKAKPKKTKVDPSTFIPNDGDDEAVAIDETPPK